MIVCIRCGAPNKDKARFCIKCRHKLQSSRAPVISCEGTSWEPLEKLTTAVSRESRSELLRMAEAGGYSLAVLVTIVFCAFYGKWWPLYGVASVVALLAWVRKI